MRHLLIASVALFGLAGAAFAQNATSPGKHVAPATTGATTSSGCSASADFSDNCAGEPVHANTKSVRSGRTASQPAPSNGCSATADFSDNC